MKYLSWDERRAIMLAYSLFASAEEGHGEDPDEYPSLFPDCSVGLDSHGYLGTAGCSSAGALSGAIRFAGTIGNPGTARNGACPTPGRDQISRRFALYRAAGIDPRAGSGSGSFRRGDYADPEDGDRHQGHRELGQRV